jgi:hypothetical protein
VAQAADAEHRRRWFCGRHPVVMFVMLPLLAIPLASTGLVAGVIGLHKAAQVSGLSGPWSTDQFPATVAVMGLVCTLIVLLPAALTAAGLTRLAARAGLGRWWPMSACLILGLIAGASRIDLRLSGLSQQSSLTLGLGFGAATALSQVAKVAAPILVGAWILWRKPRRTSIASS